jgi:hypothetical protein
MECGWEGALFSAHAEEVSKSLLKNETSFTAR